MAVWSTTSAWVQSSSSPGSISFLFTAANGQQGFLLSGPPNSAIPGATTNAWVGFGGVYVSVASDANVSSIMPTGGQIAGLYVIPNGPETSNLHVYTVWHNGSATGITCTPGTGTGGCCVNNYATPGTIGGSVACTATAPITVAAGDTLSVNISCASSSCANIAPGISLIWEPTTPGQAVLNAQWDATPATTRWAGLDDTNVFSTASPFQVTPNVPVSMTIKDLTACIGSSPGGSASWTLAPQYATAPATSPTTAAGPTVSLTSSTVCPSFTQDTTHSFAAGPGYSLFHAQSVGSGSPAGSSIWKIGMVATVP